MKIYVSFKAELQLRDLPLPVQNCIIDKIQFYMNQENLFSFAKKLINHDEYRFRIGDYRVLFIIEDDSLKIVKIESRDKAYN